MIDGSDFRKKLYDKAVSNGADPTKLIDKHAASLVSLSESAAKALNGDERIKLHLEAQFRLGKFSVEADSFLEAKAWWDALQEVLLDIVSAGISTLATAAAQGLVQAMKDGNK